MDTALPRPRPVTMASSRKQDMAGETTPWLMTWVVERPRPMMTRCPTDNGRAAA